MGDKAGAAARFSPRRLGHANLFVTDLDRSMTFYNRVCGLEEVRREPGIAAGFLTNGNTHHDIGLMEVGKEARVGVGGHTQVAESRMKRAGLNHLGWELENEKQLVEAYERAVAAGVEIHRTTDHQISHSVYVFDPEGNLNEFYADAMDDWRTVFNPDREDLISGHWDPLAAPRDTRPRYSPNPDLRQVEGAAFHSLRITHAVLVAKDLERLRRFYEDVGGLTPVSEAPDGAFLCLKGTSARYDLVLFPEREGLAPGLHHVAFEVGDADLEPGAEMLKSLGFEAERRFEIESKRSIFVKDPDGIGIEFYTPGARVGDIDIARAGPADQQLYLV
jgi:catechol 2,3-dioxygenase